MAEATKIAWADATFNPWIGCQKIAPGCKDCYAESMVNRWGGDFKHARVKTSEANWKKPLKWNRDAEAEGIRRRVFCASLADVFEDWDGPIMASGKQPVILAKSGRASDGTNRMTMDDLRRDLFALIDQTPWLDWLLLTKRPQNVLRMWARKNVPTQVSPTAIEYRWTEGSRRPNVFLGTSVSDQPTADALSPELLKLRDVTPCLFVSAEPLLGPIDFGRSIAIARHRDIDVMLGRSSAWLLNQIIIGCESNGPRVGRLGEFRDEYEWIAEAASIVEQCRAAGVACFVKQVPINGRVSHDPAEWPEDLRVRQFPEVAAC